MRRAIWGAIALVTLLRAIAAFTLPLTGDEAYYWEWSRRLAFGYVDHPPAVAWTIAAFAWLGHQPGFVRLGFVLCGAVASLALAAAATELTGDRRAGAIAALALTLTPLASLVFGTATPDGPYLMFWALALWFATRSFKGDRATDWALLGIAIGGVLLARVLGFALLFGIVAYSLTGENRRHWRRGVPLMLASTFVVCLPFVIWNATHGWVTLAFALLYRHQGIHEISTLHFLLEQIAGYSPGIWAAAMLCALRPKNALLAWTALPQFIVVMLFSLFEPVEFSWIAGFFVSLCAMLGVAYVQLSRRARRAWSIATVAPAALMLVLLFAFTFDPVATYRAFARNAAQLENGGPFEIWTYSLVAADAAKLARERDAIVMTDGYGFSAALDFDAGLSPVLIGYNWQGREARSWYADSEHPRNALFVDKEPLASRPDFTRHLNRACGRVADGGRHAYRYGGSGARPYYFTWCENLVPDGLAILRWEREPSLPQGSLAPAALATVTPVRRWTPAERDDLRRRAEAIFAYPIFARSGALAILSADGALLYAHRANAPMTPASTLKLVVAASALDAFGPRHRFETRFVALDEPGEDGVLHGPLWLVGGGDPLLTSDELRGGVGALRRLGITRIEGPVIVDDSAFAGPEQNPHWDPDDLEEGYAAATSALSLDQGTVEFRVTPTVAGRLARVTIDPPNDTIEITGSVLTGWPSDVTIKRRAGNAFEVGGSLAPGRPQKYWKPVLGIPSYVGGAVLALLAQQGIAVAGGAQHGPSPLAGQTLWQHGSQPLSKIVAEMLVHSNNHSAEQLLRLLGGRSGRAGSDEAGLAAERAALRKLGIERPGLTAYDGSGLAPSDKISPLALAQLIAAELRGPDRASFLESLPRVGMEGTVRYHVLHAALGRARAKSGHLRGVNALAGTVQTRRHGRVSFAFVVNDPSAESQAVYKAQDRALDTLAEF